MDKAGVILEKVYNFLQYARGEKSYLVFIEMLSIYWAYMVM